jgi:hypothetical protein
MGAAARAQALKMSLEADEGVAPSEPAVESSATATPSAEASPAADSGGGAPAVDPARQKAWQERQERLARVRARDEQAEQERQQRSAARAKDSEVETMRKRLAELEPLDSRLSNEDALLAEAERRGVPADKLVAAIRKRLTDPSAVAEAKVMGEADKIRAEMKAQDERHKAEIAAIKAEKEAAEQARLAQEKTTTFLSSVATKTETHPRTARLLARHKEAGLIGFANHHVAQYLPEGYSHDELHDQIEQLLEDLDAFPAPAAAVGTPANGASQPPKKNGAGQPATTLSNALTSGRESLVEEVPLHKLSREERVRRARESSERE